MSNDDTAEQITQYICSIKQDLSKKIPLAENPLSSGDYSLNKNAVSSHLKVITLADHLKAMQKFKVSKRFGVDAISTGLNRNCCNAVKYCCK